MTWEPDRVRDAMRDYDRLREENRALRGTCRLLDRGSYRPSHDFYRVECSECGVVFWRTHGHLPVVRYCPGCGRRVV